MIRFSKQLSGQAGFTLMELLIVLAIIALGATLVVPSITSGDAKEFSAQVRQAESALKYARRMAIVRSTPMIATFRATDPAEFSPALPEEEEGGRRPDQLRIPRWESEDIAIRFRTNPDELPEEADQVQITFFPQGGSTGGILNFERNELRASIEVDPITGRIRSNLGEELE